MILNDVGVDADTDARGRPPHLATMGLCTWRQRKLWSIFADRKVCLSSFTASPVYSVLEDIITRVLTPPGQRAMIGKCSMDRNCPDYYVEGEDDAIRNSTAFVEYFPHLCPAAVHHQTDGEIGSRHSLSSGYKALSINASGSGIETQPPLVQPILTPRMAISTTPALLTHLSNLSKRYNPPLALQTHLSENMAEIAQTLSLFPEAKSYTAVYDHFEILGPGTILAHCVHLTHEERTLIADRGAGISHCPTSNFHLGSGAARVREMLDQGIKVGPLFAPFPRPFLFSLFHFSGCNLRIESK